MLEVKGLVAGYGGGEVLHGIDLVVNEREGVIVLGPNGHGKTTLLRTITGLLPPRAGKVLLDGKEITRWRADSIAAAGLVHIPQGDLLFPEGGYRLSPAGQAELANNIAPKLRSAPPNSKFVVYGYTDNLPVGPPLRQQGIPDNLTLSTRRAAEVVTFLVSQGVPAASISAKGFGDTRPVASNDTPQGRAQNRRIEITIQGPG